MSGLAVAYQCSAKVNTKAQKTRKLISAIAFYALLGFSSAPAWAQEDSSAATQTNNPPADITLNIVTSIQRLRELDLGSLHSHKANWANSKYDSWTSYLVGDITPDDYNDIRNANPGNGYYHEDPFGMSPLLSGDLDWLASTGNSSAQKKLFTHQYLGPLAAKFFTTNDTKYADRYMNLVHDFATKGLPHLQLKENDAGEILRASFGIDGMFEAFAVIAKALDNEINGGPGNGYVSFGDHATQPDLNPLPNDPELVARAAKYSQQMDEVVTHLFEYAADTIIDFYSKRNKVVNQRVAGAIALKELIIVFEENEVAQSYALRVDELIGAMAQDVARSDGGMFEASWGYNLNVLEEIRELVIFDPNADWTPKISEDIENFERLIDALESPFGTLPQLGNSGWKNGGSVDTGPIGQESFAAPMSGFYVQRSGRASEDEDYMFLYDKVETRGHVMNGGNSIQVAAHGKKLLITGGTPNYGASPDVPSDVYRSEDSTWKNNTIVVDGVVQHKMQATNGLEDPDAVQANRWLDSETFDYTEATFDRGYGTHLGGTQHLQPIINDVTHTRKVVYLEEEGIWVVIDTMHSTTQHDYTQIWKFAEQFGKNDVEINKATGNITGHSNTSDQSVNLEIKQFSTADINYVKHHGSDGGNYGYIGTNYADGVEFSVDVHAEFQGTGDGPNTGSVTVITVLNPYVGDETQSSGIQYVDQSNTSLDIAGAELTFASGSTLTIRAASTTTDLSLSGSYEHLDNDLLLQLDRADGQQAILVTGDRADPTSSYQQAGGETDYVVVPDKFEWVEGE